MLFILVIIVIAILFLIGLIGSVLPSMPGPPFVLLGILIYAIYNDFADISFNLLMIFAAITLFSLFLDQLAAILGAKKAKGSNYSVIGSFIAGFIGLAAYNLIGLIAGVFVGAFMGELVFAQKSPKASFNVGVGSLIGFLAGSVIKFLLSAAMIIIFLAIII